MTLRVAKLLLVFAVALFYTVVVFNNITDYNSNYQFVRHVLSMDTTFPGNALMGRAITSPTVWTLAYWAIIVVEAVTGIVLALATVRLAANLGASADRFNSAKTYVVVGAGLGFLLWFTGFMVVGGEWFATWQSKVWNGQASAFRFYITLLAVVIFVNQPDGELNR